MQACSVASPSNGGKCGGKPCIRGMRIRVSDILEMMGEGVTMEQILADLGGYWSDRFARQSAVASNESFHVK